MTTTTTISGHIGNLTADQESRLGQLWAIVLKLHDAASLGPHEPEKEEDSSLERAETAAGSPNTNSAYTAEFAETLQEVGIQGAELKSVKDALQNSTVEELRLSLLSTAKHDHPDLLMLRFLRARKWDVNKAFVMMLNALVWRVKHRNVDENIVANGELNAVRESKDTSDPEKAKASAQFLEQMRMGKGYIHGVDKTGRPIVVVKARLHKPSQQSEEVINRYILHVIESARLLLATPTETVAVIFDMTGFSLSNMEYAPVKFLIECFEANYPESLGVMLIHNAPWIFSGIWKIIKGWMDPVIVAKVQFTNSAADLQKFIAPTQLVKELGGKEDWTYNFIEPTESENAKMADTATRDALLAKHQRIGEDLLRITSEWVVTMAKGDKIKEGEVKARREDVVEKLRQNYWKLDPYTRAKNVLDRERVIQPGGKIEFYPGPATEVDAAMAKALEVEHVERTQVKVVNV